MGQKNEPDGGIEKNILDSLNLNDEQREGATKFMVAMSGLWDIDKIEVTDEDDHIPTNTTKPLDEPQMNSLMNVMDEFLNSYILVGYDLGGNRVNSFSFPSEMSADAGLTNLIASVKTCESMVREGILSNKGNDYE
jgi:hypothetical protein